MLRIGQGIDVHAFADDRKLILGGVEIAAERGLIGHSDADVLCHAVMDALLGAMGSDDIGALFPDNDPAYKDADSMVLLSTVMDSVRKHSYRVINADCTLLMEAPKIAPYRQAIKERLSQALDIESSALGLKATTMEKLGFIGREEGIVASCVVLLEQR